MYLRKILINQQYGMVYLSIGRTCSDINNRL